MSKTPVCSGERETFGRLVRRVSLCGRGGGGELWVLEVARRFCLAGEGEKKNQHNEPKLPLCLTLCVSLSPLLPTLAPLLPSSSRRLLLRSQISCLLAAFGEKGQISISNVCRCFLSLWLHRHTELEAALRLEVRDRHVFKYPTLESACGAIFQEARPKSPALSGLRSF